MKILFKPMKTLLKAYQNLLEPFSNPIRTLLKPDTGAHHRAPEPKDVSGFVFAATGRPRDGVLGSPTTPEHLPSCAGKARLKPY